MPVAARKKEQNVESASMMKGTAAAIQTTRSSNVTAKSSVWSDLPRRLATICIGVPMIWNMLQQPTLAYVFFMGVHTLSAWEFTLLEPMWSHQHQSGTSIQYWSRLCFCLVSVALASIHFPGSIHNNIGSLPISDSLFLCALVLTSGIWVMMERHHWLVGLLVVTIPFRSWVMLQQLGGAGLPTKGNDGDNDAFGSTISILLVVWNTDTGALVVGRLATSILAKMEQPRWAVPTWIEKISPKKSMEGFLGGVLGGVWMTVQWVPWIVHWASLDVSPTFQKLWLTSPMWHRLGFGFTLSLLAILGDLVESSIKRQSKSKDSGSMLPGHGGILDRFDSSLLVVVFYQVLFQWTKAASD
mmetsp:Transcript_28181/g.52914  ORF Transcript_28181/g.52914 Transcript_28181/m.52914 type:complete len:356 (+) Transcript_28181:181-1248(+)